MSKKELFILNDDGTKTKLEAFNIQIPLEASLPTEYQREIYKFLKLFEKLSFKLKEIGVDSNRLLEIYRRSPMTLTQVYNALVEEHYKNTVHPVGIMNTYGVNSYEINNILDESDNVRPLTHKQRQPHYQKFNKRNKR